MLLYIYIYVYIYIIYMYLIWVCLRMNEHIQEVLMNDHQAFPGHDIFGMCRFHLYSRADKNGTFID